MRRPKYTKHNLGFPLYFPSGKLVGIICRRKKLTFLNDGSPTLLITRHTFTAIDVSMATEDLALHLNWQCLNYDMCDHFLIHNTNNSNCNKKFVTKINDKLADWVTFSKCTIDFSKSTPSSENVNKEAATLAKIIRSANKAMPINHGLKQNSNNTPLWFNSQIAMLIKDKNTAWKLF